MSSPKRRQNMTPATNAASDATTDETLAALAPLKTTLQQILEANQTAQKSITIMLQEIAAQKAANRRRREGILRQAQQQSSSNNVEPAASASSTVQSSATSTCRTKKWNRSFFTGPDHSRPEPNADILRRRRLEQSTFLYHLQPPWTKAQSDVLWKTAVVLMTATTKTTAAATDGDNAAPPHTGSGTTDWNQVSETLRLEHGFARSPDECRLHFQRLQLDRDPIPFTKQESIQIAEFLHVQGHGASNWSAIAQRLNETKTSATARPRSAWECLVAYQTKLRPIQPLVWRLPQDEFLLRYMAAAGPQCVVDGTMVREFGAILPGIPKSHLLNRIHASLLNPNLKHEAWSEEEERLLCILMKVYSQGPHDKVGSGQGTSSSSSLFLASTHFSARGTKAVTDKWKRSLDPAYSTRPFTSDEDAKLLRLVKQHPDLGWARLSVKHFSSRHSQRLAHRWTELADHDALLAQAKLVQSRKHQLEHDSAAALTESDYVVQVKPKRGRKKK